MFTSLWLAMNQNLQMIMSGKRIKYEVFMQEKNATVIGKSSVLVGPGYSLSSLCLKWFPVTSP